MVSDLLFLFTDCFQIFILHLILTMILDTFFFACFLSFTTQGLICLLVTFSLSLTSLDLWLSLFLGILK